MPNDCDSEAVTSVVVDGHVYRYHGNSEYPMTGRTYWFVSSVIMISPIPEVPADGMIFYRSKPQPFDYEDADAELPYNNDYAHLLLYGLGRLVAMSKEPMDMNKVNFCQAEYMRIEQKGKKEINKPRKKRTTVVRGFY